jgi:hypothetical protein
MSLYSRVAGLPLVVSECEIEPLSVSLSENWSRRTTVIRLRGDGAEGVGEDVTWDGDLQLAFAAAGPPSGLVDSWTFDSFSSALPELPGYRRWGIESAALDLALRQSSLSLAAVVERTPRPVRFVRSGSPDERWQAMYPELRYKLDADESWNADLVDGLRASELVDVVDLKGLYEGDWVRSVVSASLYRLVAEGLPDAWIEDPRLNEETMPVLEPHRDRITWDAALHAPEDLDALPFPPVEGLPRSPLPAVDPATAGFR